MRLMVFNFCLYALGNLALAQDVSTLEARGAKYKIFPPDREQRVLVESGGKSMFFLLGSRFALVDGQLLVLAEPFQNKPGGFTMPRLGSIDEIPSRAARPAQASAPKPIPISVQSSASCSLAKPLSRIFIDPGHGGMDLGTSVKKVHEKDIVLDFAKLVESELIKAGYSVLLSRSRDVFLPLDMRPELARKWDAQLFISIHINSAPSHEAHGTETYILNAEASDAEARKLAIKENSILKAVPQKGADTVRDILWDMEQTEYLQESATLGSKIQQSIVAAEPALKNRGVRQAPFFVLSRASMPAVLVELGYLSNPRDRVYLLSKKFQEKLAKAIGEGVKMYGESCKLRK